MTDKKLSAELRDYVELVAFANETVVPDTLEAWADRAAALEADNEAKARANQLLSEKLSAAEAERNDFFEQNQRLKDHLDAYIEENRQAILRRDKLIMREREIQKLYDMLRQSYGELSAEYDAYIAKYPCRTERDAENERLRQWADTLCASDNAQNYWDDELSTAHVADAIRNAIKE